MTNSIDTKSINRSQSVDNVVHYHPGTDEDQEPAPDARHDMDSLQEVLVNGRQDGQNDSRHHQVHDQEQHEASQLGQPENSGQQPSHQRGQNTDPF